MAPSENPTGRASPEDLFSRPEAGHLPDLGRLICERCDAGFLGSAPATGVKCPHCFRGALVSAVDPGGFETPQPSPEQILPFALPPASLQRSLEDFARRIPFAPADLKAERLLERLEHTFVPMWLVDSEVLASWQAEVGFDYQVVSHQDRYDQQRGGWSSQQVTETRIRWEARLGRLERRYDNVAAPAMEGLTFSDQTLGGYQLAMTVPYDPHTLGQALIRTPDRPAEDAWPEAELRLQGLATDQCRLAAGADHIRQFSWSPQYRNRNWTLLLLPLLSSYYHDDEGRPQPVFVQGQSGRTSGSRRASIRRAQAVSWLLLGTGLMAGLGSLVLLGLSGLLPLLAPIGVLGLLLAFGLGLAAIAPIAIAARFNRANPVAGHAASAQGRGTRPA